MYSKYEKPIISATIFYYDIEYKEETSRRVLEILEKYNMYPPEKMYADHLTKNRFVFADDKTRELFVKAYSEKDVLEIDMASGESRKVDEFWRVDWGLTYYKKSRIVGNKSFMPWNTLTIQSTYGRLHSQTIYEDFFSCVKELVRIVSPFYMLIDDIDNKVMLRDKAHEPHFVPDRIQEIYWGNYFGKEHCEYFGKEKLLSLPATHIEEIGEGVFFTLTDSVHEFNSKETILARKQIRQMLGLNRNVFQTGAEMLKNPHWWW